jgi:hypothetical protein
MKSTNNFYQETEITLPFPIIYATIEERHQNDKLGQELFEQYGSVNNPEFKLMAKSIAYRRLPDRHTEALSELTSKENGFPAILFKQLTTVVQSKIGLTPKNWTNISEEQMLATIRHQIIQYLYMELIGKVIEIKEQRGGGITHHILPIHGHENDQVGSSSHSMLLMHTEDAPLINCCDFLSLFCLRNFERATSALCSVNDLEISEIDRIILREHRFIIPPDPSVSNSISVKLEPVLKPILYGNLEAPFIQVAFADQLDTQIDLVALGALERLAKEVERKTIYFVSEPGDLLLFSNLQCLHGRGPFVPQYGKGQSRWMLRVMGVDGLAKSLEFRNPGSRLIIERSC